ncbi:MAG: AI-2E family transporter, partial [Oscillospiraceae bacterium]|nr:AI-2E family transporter [Oscillospiraceae bacterium]
MVKLREWLKYLPPFVIALLLFSVITQYEQTISMLGTVWNAAAYLLARFFIGFGLAYFLNFPMRFIEYRLKLRRWASLSIIYTLLLSLLALMGWIVIPAVTDSAMAITASLGNYYTQVMSLLDGLLVGLPPDTAAVIDDTVKN